MIWGWLKDDVTTDALLATRVSGSCVELSSWNMSGELIHVFTPSSLRWALWMCRGSRTGAAISVHSGAALMMMAVDLLCSAFWERELLAVVRPGKWFLNMPFLGPFPGSGEGLKVPQQHDSDALRNIQLWSKLFFLPIHIVGSVYLLLKSGSLGDHRKSKQRTGCRFLHLTVTEKQSDTISFTPHFLF